MTDVGLELSREQVLAFRRRTGGLDAPADRTPGALRRAAWVGLQDSMPRAAVLSLHARVEGTQPDDWDHSEFVQLWGPRYGAYVVPAEDRAVFSLGRFPDSPQGRHRAIETADRLEEFLGGARMTYAEAGHGMGIDPNALRYAAPTGRVLIRWDGARRPLVWTVDAPDLDPADARRELARRYLHVFGPSSGESFGRWAGITLRAGIAALESLRSELITVSTPLGPAWALASDEESLRQAPGVASAVRLLPSGDAYYLLHGADRTLLVTDAERRGELWTSRVWPGAVLVAGEIVGTWRRSKERVTVSPWRRMGAAARHEIEEEATALPLPDIDEIRVEWDD